VEILTELLSASNPRAFSRASRVRRLVRHLLPKVELERPWEVEISAMLSQLGCITISGDTLKAIYEGKEVEKEQKALFQNHPKLGFDLVNRIPRMETIATIILYQQHDVTQKKDSSEEEIPLGARILKIVLDYDSFLIAEGNLNHAMGALEKNKQAYDPTLFDHLINVIFELEEKYEKKTVDLQDIRDNMILDEDIKLKNGTLLFEKGQEVNTLIRTKLADSVGEDGIKETLQVLIPIEETEKTATPVGNQAG